MNARIEEARRRLAFAHGEIRKQLRGIDGLLRAAVAQDPAAIPEALELQKAYGAHGFEVAALQPLEQPGRVPAAEAASAPQGDAPQAGPGDLGAVAGEAVGVAGKAGEAAGTDAPAKDMA